MKPWAQSQDLYLREPLNHKKQKTEKISGPDLVGIDPKDLEVGGKVEIRKQNEKNVSERDIWEGGP